MNIIDISMIAICLILLINKATREGAFILLVADAFYFAFIIDLPMVYYFSITAAINLIVGIFLHLKYKMAAVCSYLLVFTGVLGRWLYVHDYSLDLYNVISVIILFIQLTALSTRILTNGTIRYPVKHHTNVTVGFDGRKACDTMRKSPKKEQS